MNSNTQKQYPAVKRWTVKEFHDTFSADELYQLRPFLVRGVIWEHGRPTELHGGVASGVADALRPLCGDLFYVRQRSALPITNDTDLVPDVAVVVGRIRDYKSAHPTTAVLVVEVADNSLHEDLCQKAELNAEAGIADYWVVDVVGFRVFVFREPRLGRDGKHEYADVTMHEKASIVAPLFAPDAIIPVSDLLS